MVDVFLGRVRLAHGGIQGFILINGVWQMHTLERTWEDNTPFISCVPAGDYNLVYEYSNKFKRGLYELKGVPGRTECKFHAIDFVEQLEGCIGPGMDLLPDDSVNPPFNGTSRTAENKLHTLLKGETSKLHIRWWDGGLAHSGEG